ncbi:T-lymphocyte surface antigen Ly-9-like [Echinops telfairi]|uniref:T-lymphocyte surface antigen Ly-9-like n=1 Tax=Echinops telfairi TaxID=9371 RepID=A0AC55DRE6_ECHTE|nr:T-lymphocyte surface antigen Ly-9-like [Echinops telfairi]
MAGPKRSIEDWAPGPCLTHRLRIPSNKPSPTPWAPLLFLLMAASPHTSSVSAGLRASGEDAVSTNIVGTLGKSVTLPLNISMDTEIEHVIWIHLQKAIVIMHPGRPVTFLDKSYQSRVSISSQSFSLSISNLIQKVEGSYNAQINNVNSNFITEERFTLHIYGQLQKPQVTLNATMNDSGSCNIALTCFMERAETSVQFTWTRAEPHASESHEGSTLTISWMLCDPDLVYTCSATNPVSQNRSRPVSVQELCTGPGAFGGEAMRETVLGILGESVTLPLKVPANHSIKKVVWRFNTSILSKASGEVTAEGSLTESKETEKDRVLVSSQDYSLKIRELKMEDAGPYSAYVCSEVTSTKHFALRIHYCNDYFISYMSISGPERRLRKPNIPAMLGPEDGICKDTLTCSVD